MNQKVTIEQTEDDFCIYDETGHLVEDNFPDYENAKIWASENDYEVAQQISTALVSNEENEWRKFFRLTQDGKTLLFEGVEKDCMADYEDCKEPNNDTETFFDWCKNSYPYTNEKGERPETDNPLPPNYQYGM